MLALRKISLHAIGASVLSDAMQAFCLIFVIAVATPVPSGNANAWLMVSVVHVCNYSAC